MNVRRSVELFLILLLGFGPSRVVAQGLPSEIRTTTNANAVRLQIERFVTEQVPALSGADPAAMTAARETILSAMEQGKGSDRVISRAVDMAQTRDTIPSAIEHAKGAVSVQPSPEFLRGFSEAVAAELEPLLKSDNPRVRLNVAVIVARSAEKSPSLKLIPLAQTALSDDSEAVVLWGLKASKSLIPAVLSSGPAGKSSPLIPAFVQAAKRYSDSGPMIQTAYDSLRIDMNPAVPLTAFPPVVDCMHELLSQRLDQYRVGVPDLPATDASATAFLTGADAWRKQSPAQQLRTVQLISDLIAVAAQRASTPGMGNIERSELVEVLKLAGKALKVVGKWTNTAPSMDDAVSGLTLISSSMAPVDLKKAADQVFPGLKKIPQFSQLKDPPKLQQDAT